MYNRTDRKRNTIPSICLGLLYAIGAHFYYVETKAGILSSAALLLIRTFISAAFIMISIGLIDVLFESGVLLTKPQMVNKRECAVRFFVFSLIWLPLIVIKYPGAMCWDTWQMLYQYRTNTITTHHSVLYTVLLGKLVDTFEKTGNANPGLFIFVVLHMLIAAAAFSYSLALIERLGVKPIFVNIAMLILLVNPYIAGYIGVAMKDVLYSALMVLLTAMIIDMQSNLRMNSSAPDGKWQ